MFSKYLLPNRFNLIVNRYWNSTRIRKSEFSSTQINLKDETEKDSTSIIQIKKVLKTHNISYQDGITNIKTSCPVCEKNEDQSRDIYINKTTGKIQILNFSKTIH
jgi:hypothetical protein